MRIDPKSWHAKIYQLEHDMAGEFCPTRTDLCTYMRHVCVYFPMRFLWRTFFLLLPLSIFLVPLAGSESFGLSMVILGSITLGVVVVLGVIFGIFYFFEEIAPQLRIKYRIREGYNSVKGFVRSSIFGEWFKAHKEKYCPTIQIGVGDV